MNFKQNWGLILAFDFIFSISFSVGRRIIFGNSVWDVAAGSGFLPMNGSFILDFVCCFIIFGLLLIAGLIVNFKVSKNALQTSVPTTKKNMLLFFISLAVFVVCWLPYFLSCLPGGIYADTFSSIAQALAMDDLGWHALNNHHPILYTLMIRSVLLIADHLGKGTFWGLTLFTLVQYLGLAAALAYLYSWMYRHRIQLKIIIPLIFFTAFFPLFPLYAVSVWKDTPFCIFLLLYILALGELAFDRSTVRLRSLPYLIRLSLLSLLVAFSRNNGKYIVALVFIVLVIIQLRKLLQFKKMVCIFIATIAAIQVIQGPVYNHMGYNVDTATESLAIPIQQICYVVSHDYELTPEQTAYIETIAPISEIKEYYIPSLFDSIKWYAPNFHISIIEQDFKSFLSVYLQLLVAHPVAYIRAYLLETSGFWAVNIASMDGYIQNNVWTNSIGLEKYDLFQQLTGIDFQAMINQFAPISSAIFFWFLMYAAFIVIANRDWYKLLLLIAPFANWLSIMIATPLACSLRYVYILVLMIPLDVMLIFSSHINPKLNGRNIDIDSHIPKRLKGDSI